MTKFAVLSRLDVLMFLATLAVVLAIFAPARSQVKRVSWKVVCSTNLKGLGQATTVYSGDFDSAFPQLPGYGPWARELGFEYDLVNPDFDGRHANVSRTVTAAWYLLVRYADVSPRAFICPASFRQCFDGSNSDDLDLVQLWDFGPAPWRHVSYSLHHPYGQYPADATRSPGFALAADMSPWFSNGDLVNPNPDANLPPQVISVADPTTYAKGNTLSHTEYEAGFLFWKETKRARLGFGQNVLYVDGGVQFEQTPNSGLAGDNIFTFWSAEENRTAQDTQGGKNPTDRSPETDARSKDDSFLVF